MKGKSGILKSQVTRKAFLSSPERRVRFIYVPKHSSWLNQVEIWFSVVVRLLDFIDYFNRTMAKPYRWTYTGRPLTI